VSDLPDWANTLAIPAVTSAIVAYVVARQFLLRLRAERREYSWRRSGHAARERS